MMNIKDDATSIYNENDEMSMNLNGYNEYKSVSEILKENINNIKSSVEIMIVTPLMINISINESILTMMIYMKWKKKIFNHSIDILSFEVPNYIIVNKKFPYVLKIYNHLSKDLFIKVEIEIGIGINTCHNQFSKQDFLCEEITSDLEIKSFQEKELFIWLYPFKEGFSTLPTVVIRNCLFNDEVIYIRNGDVYVNSN